MSINHSNAIRINIHELSNEIISIEELSEYYKEKLENSNLLMSGYFKGRDVISEGLFEDDIWVIYRQSYANYRYINFKELNRFNFIKVNKKQKLLIKCWIAQLFLDNYYEFDSKFDNAINPVRTSEHTITTYSKFLELLEASNNFSEDFLNFDKGDEINHYFLYKYLKDTKNNKIQILSGMLSYFRFTVIYNQIEDDFFSKNTYFKYIERLELVKDDISKSIKWKSDNKIHLPSSTNILLLHYYISKFFDDEKIDEEIKMYYYPLLIWWKFTTIIPMRKNEITSKTLRDCLSIEGNSYYFSIGRSKKKHIKGQLPIITKIKITKEMYDLINTYIEKTNRFGTTRTLFSYKAQLYYRAYLSKHYPLFYSTNTTNEGNKFKYDDELYSPYQLDNLIISFYDKIIETYYQETRITERISANQTRHLAFSYLLLQEVPKVEIAILGGHGDINTLDTYTYDNNTYIDSQVFINVNKNFSKSQVNEDNLFDIVFSKPKECPIPKEYCVKTEFGNISLGYCVATEDNACENYDCYYCSNWYCEPTNNNYLTLIKIVKDEIENQQNTMFDNIKFFNNLFNSSALLYTQNESISLDKDCFQQLQQVSKKIKSNADEIIKIKTKLLESTLDRNKQYTELEVIEKLIQLNQHFNKDTVLIK